LVGIVIGATFDGAVGAATVGTVPAFSFSALASVAVSAASSLKVSSLFSGTAAEVAAWPLLGTNLLFHQQKIAYQQRRLH